MLWHIFFEYMLCFCDFKLVLWVTTYQYQITSESKQISWSEISVLNVVTKPEQSAQVWILHWNFECNTFLCSPTI